MQRWTRRATRQWFVLGLRISILTFGALGLLTGPIDNAAAHSKTCTLSTVAGAYGLSGHGTIVSNPFGLPEGPVVTVGVLFFDEDGRWVSHRSTHVNGHFASDVSSEGTYIVDPDCRFSFVDAMNNAVQFVGVFVADREEAWFMATGEGVVVTYTMKRIERKD